MSPFAPPTLAALADRLGGAGIACLAHPQDDDLLAGGDTLLLLLEDPARVPESWDLAVILPEALKTAGTGLRVLALLPAAAKALAGRYGITVFPALMLLREGGYVGSIEGLRDWDGYRHAIAALRAQPVVRAPGIGIAIQTSAAGCH